VTVHKSYYAEFTRLHHVRSDIVEDEVDLLFDKFGRRVVDVENTRRVLCRERGRSRHGVAAIRRNDLLIGLEPTNI